MQNKKFAIVLGLVVLLVGLFGVGAWLFKKEEASQREAAAVTQTDAFVRSHSPRTVANNPKVIIVEFLDPECESCRHFSPLVKSILNEFGDQVQLVVRYMPFHQNSKFAIKILEAAKKQGKFWETLTVLFQYQPEWGSHHDPQPNLIWNYLPEAGVNVEQVKADLNDPAFDEVIRIDEADGVALQVKGTPSFFVNGKPLEDFGYEPLRQMVAKELEK